MQTTDKRLQDKVMIVSGGAHPVCLGIARYLMAEGAVVIVPLQSSQDILLFREYVADIDSGRLVTLLTDMPDYEKAAEISEAIVEEYGGIDMMVTVFDGLRPVTGLLDTDTSSWQQVIDQLTVYYGAGRLILHLMRRLNKGSFICISNGESLVHYPHTALSNIAGIAITEMSRLFYKELEDTQVQFHHLFINNIAINDRAMQPVDKAGWINPWMVGEYVMNLYEGKTAHSGELFHHLLGKHAVPAAKTERPLL